ncbi:MAG: hydrolase [Mariprofundaceae bacterium]
MNPSNTPTRLECGCPSDYPDWKNADIDLAGMLVHSLKIPMFMHMPIGYEAYLMKQKNDIERLELHEKWPGFNLTRTGAFRGQMLCPLSEENSPARNMMNLPSPFHLRTQLFHGDVHDIRIEVRKMQSQLLDEGRMPKELYLSYLTCPICEEERGGKRVMLIRRWIKSKKLEARLKKQTSN